MVPRKSMVVVHPDPLESGGDAGGPADVPAGLAGSPPAQGDIAATLKSLLGQTGDSEADVQGLLERLLSRRAAGDGPSTAATGSSTDAVRLSPELLGAMENSPSRSQTGAVPEALKRAVEALGLPPVLVEKLLPAIMERFSSASSGSQEKPAGAAVRKRAKSGSTTAKKPRARVSKPAASRSRAKSSSSTKSRPSSKTRKSDGSAGSSKGTAKRSSGSSGSSGKRRSKRSSTPAAPSLEDILKGLIQ